MLQVLPIETDWIRVEFKSLKKSLLGSGQAQLILTQALSDLDRKLRPELHSTLRWKRALKPNSGHKSQGMESFTPVQLYRCASSPHIVHSHITQPPSPKHGL